MGKLPPADEGPGGPSALLNELLFDLCAVDPLERASSSDVVSHRWFRADKVGWDAFVSLA